MDKPTFITTTHIQFALHGFRERDPLPTLKRALSALSRLKLKHCLSAGTALGLYRDKRFIPHDTDIDIAVMLPWNKDHYPLTVDLVREMAQRNLPTSRSVLMGDKPAQLVFMDLENHEILVDIEFYYSGVIKDHFVHHKEEGVVVMPRYSTRVRAFGPVTAPFPNPIEQYLKNRYGAWEIPEAEKGDWKAYTTAFRPWE